MRTTFLLAVAALALPACTTYAHVARTNAPGVIDIATPPAHETGADDLYELPASSPAKVNSVVMFLHPAFGGGMVRNGAGFETSIGLSIEKDTDAESDMLPLRSRAWGVSVGMGIVQLRSPKSADGMTAKTIVDTPGPIWLEAYQRRLVVMYSAGAVVYPDTGDIGAQITIHAPISYFRVRYVENSGFEALIGYDLNFPFAFAWSR